MNGLGRCSFCLSLRLVRCDQRSRSSLRVSPRMLGSNAAPQIYHFNMTWGRCWALHDLEDNAPAIPSPSCRSPAETHTTCIQRSESSPWRNLFSRLLIRKFGGSSPPKQCHHRPPCLALSWSGFSHLAVQRAALTAAIRWFRAEPLSRLGLPRSSLKQKAGE